MMPTEDAAVVAAELTRRFGVSAWSFALTATDANRWALRLCRAITGRPRVLVNAWCYHGSVDESLIVTSPTGPVPRPGNVGAPCDVTESSRVVEFNDLEGLEAELAHGDVAVVLMEPALTNMGIVLPEPGYLEGVRPAHPGSGDAPDHRRDPHPLRRPGRLHRGVGPGPRHRHPGQGHRRWHPDRRLRPRAPS